MEGAGITIFDYILLPFYLLAIYKIAHRYRDKYYPPDHPHRPYFINGLTVKIIGAIFIGLVYQYYYGGGDTFNFFFHTSIINSTFLQAPDTWLRLITHTANDANITDSRALTELWWYNDTSSYVTACFGAFIGIFCFTRYLLISVIIASLTFIGMWLMFITFAKQYPHIVKYIAIAILFMPGPIVWGSGLFKDSFCMFSIGCLVYCFYQLSQKGKFKYSLLLLLLISIAILVLIKIYIIAILLPALIIRSVLNYKKKLKGNIGKKVVFYFFLLGLYLGVALLVRKAASALSNISPEAILATMKMQKDYLLKTSLDQNGAAYDLGDFDPTISGVFRMTLPAINVTLFRPYLWESRSAIQLLNAVESAGVLLLTLYLLFKRNLFKSLKTIYQDPNLVMCLFFSLFFALIVGITSYNFGSLSRYKIPCTPFFTLFLVILIWGKKAETNQQNNLIEVS